MTVRLTDEQWFQLFNSIKYKDIFHASSEDFTRTEIEEFGIKIECFEVNANVYLIINKPKFIFACIRAGINPVITEE